MQNIGLCEETTLLDLVTEPELEIMKWLVREVDKDGPFIIPLEEILKGEDPDDPRTQHYWQRPVRILWNADMSAALVVAVEHIEANQGDPGCTVLYRARNC